VTASGPPDEPLRIANCSGFFGDRLAAAREQVEGGPIDVLTGDWLAELTMLILAGQRVKRPEAGYARTFVTQMDQVLATCLVRGIKVVANAGGLNPTGCAAAVRAVAEAQGLSPRIAHVEGDDLLPRLPELTAAGERFANLDTGESLVDAGVTPITANAYLGGFGIKAALDAGADVVITGRVTDAALVVGPAAWRFGWSPEDLDALAGAVVAGHVIECGAQATGGNYSFFREVPDLEHPGFPIAEVHADGSSVITKHPGTGGLVSIGTVTAQLLYEIAGPEYANPDVVARFDTIQLADDGPDRVAITGVRGDTRPDRAKVAINYAGGFRNAMTFVLTGLDIEAKAELAERTLWKHVPGGREAFDEVDDQLVRHDVADPPTNDQALAELRVTVKDRDQAKVGRAFSNPAIEMALASYPGFFMTSPPTGAKPFGVYWPALVDGSNITQHVWLDGEMVGDVSWHPATDNASPDLGLTTAPTAPAVPSALTTRAPLGTVVGARSGDKGGNANVGLWARTDAAFAWLDGYVTVDRFRELLPEAADLPVERHSLPNLRAVNFVVHGLLGRGVADSTRTDAQAKGLGEYLRARLVDVPTALLS
jgi:hypothetical protein